MHVAQRLRFDTARGRQEDAPARKAQDQRGAQAGGTAADDATHTSRPRRRPAPSPFGGRRALRFRSIGVMAARPAPESSLARCRRRGRLVGDLQLGFDLAYSLLELLDPASDRPADLVNPLRPEDQSTIRKSQKSS